jgi:hypothetical protein
MNPKRSPTRRDGGSGGVPLHAATSLLAVSRHDAVERTFPEIPNCAIGGGGEHANHSPPCYSSDVREITLLFARRHPGRRCQVVPQRQGFASSHVGPATERTYEHSPSCPI